MLFVIMNDKEHTIETRGHAAKILENITRTPDLQKRVVESGLSQRMINFMNQTQLLYVKKQLSQALSQLAFDESCRLQLAKEGLITTLHQANSDKNLTRKIHSKALHLISSTLSEQPDWQSLVTSEEERQLIQHYNTEYQQLKQTLSYRLLNPLLENGIYLYAWTALGGATWASATSLWKKDTMKILLRNTFRTSIVTGLVPAYFVGFCVSVFTHLHRRLDTQPELFALYSASTFLTLYPWYYGLPILERFSPLWLGGHVVGFAFLFLYLISSDADVVKSDRLLQLQDEGYGESSSSAKKKKSRRKRPNINTETKNERTLPEEKKS